MTIRDYNDDSHLWEGEIITGYDGVDFFMYLSVDEQTRLVESHKKGEEVEYFNPASREWEVVTPLWEPRASYRLKEICDETHIY